MNRFAFSRRMKFPHGESGMSIIELLVAMTVAGIVATAIVAIFDNNSKLFSGEGKVVVMQGNAAVAMGTLARNIRHVGYDPKEAGPAVFGLTSSTFSAAAAAEISSLSEIYFTADIADGDQPFPEKGTRNSSREYIAFRLNGTDLERANVVDAAGTIGSWNSFAHDISSLTFVYGYADGTYSDAVGLPTNAVAGRGFEDVRSIRITLTARTEGNHDLTKIPSTETVTTLVKLRNNTGT